MSVLLPFILLYNFFYFSTIHSTTHIEFFTTYQGIKEKFNYLIYHFSTFFFIQCMPKDRHDKCWLVTWKWHHSTPLYNWVSHCRKATANQIRHRITVIMQLRLQSRRWFPLTSFRDSIQHRRCSKCTLTIYRQSKRTWKTWQSGSAKNRRLVRFWNTKHRYRLFKIWGSLPFRQCWGAYDLWRFRGRILILSWKW